MATVNTRKSKTAVRPCVYCEFLFDRLKGQCPSCKLFQSPAGTVGSIGPRKVTVRMSDIEAAEVERYICGPWDYCFGGGVAKTGVHLIGGAPGAGKSTLSLQMADEFPSHVAEGEVLYVGAEETVKEIKARGSRLRMKNMHRIQLLPMNELEAFAPTMLSLKPIAVFLDSLPGFVTDPQEGLELCANLKSYAIELNAPMIVIDHINKDEDFAGLMKLQHAVDGTFTLFPIDKDSPIRVFETIKNRYGPNARSSFFEMGEHGLTHLRNNCDLDEDEDEDA